MVGPESTGKSYLSRQLAEHYGTEWVPEFARPYLDEIDRPYKKDDLNQIAIGQIELEDKLMKKANRVLICDTNLLVIKVWSEHKYGHCEEWINAEIKNRHYDLHLLTYIDLPWEDDPQREHPHMREYFYDVYYQLLNNLGLPFVEIRGDYRERFKTAISAVDPLL